MRMVGANTVDGQDDSEMLRLAAAVEGSTRHPLADAVLLAARNKHLQVRHLCPSQLPSYTRVTQSLSGCVLLLLY